MKSVIEVKEEEETTDKRFPMKLSTMFTTGSTASGPKAAVMKMKHFVDKNSLMAFKFNYYN